MNKVGIISLSDERPHANERVRPVITRQGELLRTLLSGIPGVQPVVVEEPVNSPSKAREAGRQLAREFVTATVFNVPTFGFPKFGVMATLFAPGPYMIVASMDSSQPSPAGIAGLGGSMTQLGIHHERLWMDLRNPAASRRLEAFVSAAAAVSGLKGSVLGLIGGRSMGLYPMVADGNQLFRKFGIDVDHVDQLELIRASESVEEEKVDRAVQWLQGSAASISFDDVLTLEKLRAQIRNYEALKTLVRRYEFDFVAVKCHYEMSEYQQPLCLAAMFCNDPYDWDGPKQPLVFACEADQDGAVTMQILKLVSGGKPTCLLDTRYYDENSATYLFQNCGGAPSWFARRSEQAEENLKLVEFRACVPKFRGGGAQADYRFGEGELTLARLYRAPDGYHMLIVKGRSVSEEESAHMPSGEANWPKAAIKIGAAPERLMEKLNCVHVHAVAGDYTEELRLVCKYLDIIPEAIDM